MLRMTPDQIGGGLVLSAFTMGDRYVRVGERLSGEEIRGIPPANRQCLLENRFIAAWPVGSKELPSPPEAIGKHIIHCGGGQYDVIMGVKLNERPLSKDEAEDLATRPD